MSRVTLTRMSLLRERARIRTAERGVEILRSKRDALLGELHHAAAETVEFRQKTGALASRAVVALTRAQGLAGDAALRSLAAVGRREVQVEVVVRNVWGVRMPSITAVPMVRRSLDRGYGLASTSAAVDAAAEAHEELVAFVLQRAPQEIRLRRLAADLRRTTRKVNTLEHDVIPHLRANVRRIGMALEEQERDDRHRLQLLESEIS